MVTFFGQARAADLVRIFSILLPVGGLAVPLTAHLLEHYQRWAYRINLVLSFIYGLCLMSSWVPVQILGFVIISVSRQMTYSIVYCFTLDFFGQENLGKLLAVNNGVVFILSLLQYPVAWSVGHTWFPSWYAADWLMIAIAVPLILSNGCL